MKWDVGKWGAVKCSYILVDRVTGPDQIRNQIHVSKAQI